MISELRFVGTLYWRVRPPCSALGRLFQLSLGGKWQKRRPQFIPLVYFGKSPKHGGKWPRAPEPSVIVPAGDLCSPDSSQRQSDSGQLNCLFEPYQFKWLLLFACFESQTRNPCQYFPPKEQSVFPLSLFRVWGKQLMDVFKEWARAGPPRMNSCVFHPFQSTPDVLIKTVWWLIDKRQAQRSAGVLRKGKFYCS
jgi:hypothetical protein